MKWAIAFFLWLIAVYGYLKIFGFHLDEDDEWDKIAQYKFEKWVKEEYEGRHQ